MGWLVALALIATLFYLYYTLFNGLTCYGGFLRVATAALAAVSLPASISYFILSRRLDNRDARIARFEALKAATIHVTTVLAGLLARC